MLIPRCAVVIDCETTDLPGGVTGNDGYQNLRNSIDLWDLGESHLAGGFCTELWRLQQSQCGQFRSQE